MDSVWQIIKNAYSGYSGYLWNEITNPGWHNYFYWLIGVSIFFMLLEWFAPWRGKQGRFRKDFWLDAFYMFFNFFLFSLIIYNAASDVVVHFLNNAIESVTGFDVFASNPMRQWPFWAILLIGFFVRDFIQWWVHRLLHRVEILWRFHKVHHSVEQMGFAAHLRYHWMETLVYRSFEYFPLALLGIGLYDFFIIHIFSLAVGHYNHSNITVNGHITGAVVGALIGIPLSYGYFDLPSLSQLWSANPFWIVMLSALAGSILLGPFMKYIFNSPEMHIWHHAYHFPKRLKYGINFGLSLAIWDYIFGTAHVPYDGRDIQLGFPGVEEFPSDFLSQVTYGFSPEKIHFHELLNNLKYYDRPRHCEKSRLETHQ